MGGDWFGCWMLVPASPGVRSPCSPPLSHGRLTGGRQLRPRYRARSILARSNWLLVGQALPFRRLHDEHRPLRVRRLARVVAELKLTDVLAEMAFTDVVKRADDPALQQANEAFRRVRMDVAANEFAATVVDRVALHARDALLALHLDAAVDVRLVRHQARAGIHVVANL